LDNKFVVIILFVIIAFVIGFFGLIPEEFHYPFAIILFLIAAIIGFVIKKMLKK